MQAKKEINKQLAVVPQPQPQALEVTYTQEQVQLIKDTFAKGASDGELRLFIEVAERRGLDIFSRQIFLIERWDGKKYVRNPETSIDGYRVIADRTGVYTPGDAPTFTYDEQGKLKTATAYVKKYVQGQWHIIPAVAHWDEYVGTTKNGDVRSIWKSKPHIMLAKCAEALALRKAFPAQLSGLYTREEMEHTDRADNGKTIEGEIVEQPYVSVKDELPHLKQHADLDTEINELSKALLEVGMEKAELHAFFIEVTGRSKRDQTTTDEKRKFITACKEELVRLAEVDEDVDNADDPFAGGK